VALCLSTLNLVLDPSDPRLYARYIELCRQARLDPPPLEWVREQLSKWNAMLGD